MLISSRTPQRLSMAHTPTPHSCPHTPTTCSGRSSQPPPASKSAGYRLNTTRVTRTPSRACRAWRSIRRCAVPLKRDPLTCSSSTSSLGRRSPQAHAEYCSTPPLVSNSSTPMPRFRPHIATWAEAQHVGQRPFSPSSTWSPVLLAMDSPQQFASKPSCTPPPPSHSALLLF